MKLKHTYVTDPSKALTVDQKSKVLGNLSLSLKKNLEVLNQIEGYVTNQSDVSALNHSSEVRTQINSSRSERERLNIRTPSGVNIFPKIVGGTKTSIRIYPYIVQIYVNGMFHCGGSILTKQHIITAAHCVKDMFGRAIPPQGFLIRVGSSFLYKDGTLHKVAAYVIHPQYDKPLRDNDIAVVVLDNPVMYIKDRVQKATLPPQDYVLPENAKVIAIGWGFTGIASEASSFLNHVVIRTVDQQTCVHNYKIVGLLSNDLLPITENMICAGAYGVGGKDACQGDSGGPLVNDHVLVGLTSWGLGCGEPLLPGIYTKVSSHTNWITNVIDTDDPNHSNMIRVPSSSSQVSCQVGTGAKANVVISLSYMLFFSRYKVYSNLEK